MILTARDNYRLGHNFPGIIFILQSRLRNTAMVVAINIKLHDRCPKHPPSAHVRFIAESGHH